MAILLYVLRQSVKIYIHVSPKGNTIVLAICKNKAMIVSK